MVHNLNIRPLTPLLAEQAAEELNENPKQLAENIQAIKTWLSKQPHITARTDDQFLIGFLRGCKHSLERTKERLDTYYSLRTALPDFYQSRDPLNKKNLEILNLGITTALPKTCEDGSRLILSRMGLYNPQKTNMTEVLKVSLMTTDYILCEDDQSVIAGITVIVDLQGMTFSHLTQATPTFIKGLSVIIQTIPFRIKGIHYVNPLPGFDALYKIFRAFASDKLKNRLFVHDSLETLQKYVPKNLLPNEYGGEVGSEINLRDEWRDKIIANRDWFLEDVNYKTDEKKRVGTPKYTENFFGADGSFRKLEID